jgi:radical SAM superfamily enzyme YgiQ (UPF0313 family)
MPRRSRRREDTLSREVGAVRKEWGGKLRVALVYPNRYETGMSNLGFLSVHARINARTDALCERAFLSVPGESGRPPARGRGGRETAVRTVESGRLLSEFDIVAFSLSFENDLLNLPALLSAGGVSPFREERVPSKGGVSTAGPAAPFVLAGGFAASLSPEPAGTLADAVVVGDGERALEAVLDLGTPQPGDAGYRRELASIPGVYVPGGYLPEYSEPKPGAPPGTSVLSALRPLPGFPYRVRREAVSPEEYPPLPVILAERTELGRMALVETSRGCPKMCGFCAAAHACPGFREVSSDRFRALVDAAWPHRTTIGFVGAAVLDWSPFREIAKEILDRGGAVSPASVRADLVDEEIAEILRRSGHRTVALAPECGSEPLRFRIGKQVTDERFLAAGRTLARAGIVSCKLYFLTGVPGADRDEEVEGTIRFLHRFREALLAEGRTVGRMGTVTAVLSPFVPKPFTPMQWAPMAREEELSERHARIASAVRPVPNLRVRAESPRNAVLQGYLGLSDRRVASILHRAMSGRVRPSDAAISPPLAWVAHRERAFDEFLPWEVVEGGLPKETLWARYRAIIRT